MQIEFFHDVLCAFCYALSPRLHRLVAEHPEVEVIQRGFALAKTPDHLTQMFGSPEAAKAEILHHWQVAAANDDEHRPRPAAMQAQPFPYPHSWPGLLACQAAERQGGQAAHWAMFDRVQYAHLTETRDITDIAVLASCASEVGLDSARWQSDFDDPATAARLEEDLALAQAYGITGVPTLVAEGRYGLVGAQTYDQLEAWLKAVEQKLQEEQ